MSPNTPARARGLRDIWHNVGFRGVFYQVLVVALIIGGGMYLVGNAQDALERRGISTGFDFLFEPAGFDIGEAPIAFQSTDSFGRAYLAAFLNTVKVSVLSIVFASIIGLIVGLSRLSSNVLIRTLASGYIELFRNTPQLLQLIFWSALINQLPLARDALSAFDIAFMSNRGLVLPWPEFIGVVMWMLVALVLAIAATVFISRWADTRRLQSGKEFPVLGTAILLIIGAPLCVWLMAGSPSDFSIPELRGFNYRGGVTISPEFLAVLLGLSLYIAAFIAEIVRSGIQSVGRGQIEAARSIGLKSSDLYKKIILPQALRVMIPPAAAQYVSLVKNSSLGVAIGYPELFNVNNTIITLSGHTVEAIGIMMAIYLSISLSIAALMNLYNRYVQIKER